MALADVRSTELTAEGGRTTGALYNTATQNKHDGKEAGSTTSGEAHTAIHVTHFLHSELRRWMSLLQRAEAERIETRAFLCLPAHRELLGLARESEKGGRLGNCNRTSSYSTGQRHSRCLRCHPSGDHTPTDRRVDTEKNQHRNSTMALHLRAREDIPLLTSYCMTSRPVLV
jgi:hypothetical protein